MKPSFAYSSQIAINKLMIASLPLKNKLYPNETIICLQLTNSNKQANDRFITIKKQTIS
jgi:hypothetical protein